MMEDIQQLAGSAHETPDADPHRLYPASWRARYESEFSALLEEVNPAWRTSLDLFKGAVAMQLQISSSRKILAAGPLLGTLAGLAV